MSDFYFDHRWCGPHGIGRFASEVRSRLVGQQNLPLAGSPTRPHDCIALAWVLKQKQAAGFFSPGFNVPLYARCPAVCTVHDLIHIHFARESSFAKAVYYRNVQRPAVRRSPLVLTVSEFSRQEICDWYNLPAGQVVCVGNGVSDEFTVEGKRDARPFPFVLYVGNAKPHKNVETLLRAFANGSIARDLRLILVTPPDTPLLKLATELRIADRVEFVTGLSDGELAAYYRSAAVTVLPSFYEGFGLPLVEAMACGCPVIGSARTSIPEIVDGAGLLFDPDCADSLTDSLNQLLDSESLRTELSEKGRARASSFCWDQVGDRVNRALAPYLP